MKVLHEVISLVLAIFTLPRCLGQALVLGVAFRTHMLDEDLSD